MLRLQCHNCFAPLRPSGKVLECTGCGVLYILERDELKLYEEKWQPEGLVENPQGEWVSYFIYSWKDPKPPYYRTIGFKSATYQKETTLDISIEELRRQFFGPNLRSLEERVKLSVRKAIEEVLPPGFDKYELDLSPVFRELPFLATPLLSRRYQL